MKAVYTIMEIILKHNHACPSYHPMNLYGGVYAPMFTSKQVAEEWLDEYLEKRKQTGEKSMMIPKYDEERGEYHGKELKDYSKEERFVFCKTELYGPIEDLENYKDADSDLPF